MIGFKQVATIALLAIGVVFTGASYASLYDRGNGLVYDDVLNISITKDANLFGTMFAADSSLVNKVVALGAAYQLVDGVYWPLLNITKEDFYSGGYMSSRAPNYWINYLNSQNYGGYSDWRLPSVTPVNGSSFNLSFSADGTTDNGANITSPHSELAYLFNVELHNFEMSFLLNGTYNPAGWAGKANSSFQDAAHGGANDSFYNISNNDYFLGSTGFVYASAIGTQDFYSMSPYSAIKNVWMVRTGDVAPVPIPSVAWLLGSGLGILAFTRRKNQNTPSQYY